MQCENCQNSGSLCSISSLLPLTDFQGHLDLLLYDFLFAVFSPAKIEYKHSAILGMAINLNLFERDDVYRCEYGEKKILLDLLLSANRLTASPFPGTY